MERLSVAWAKSWPFRSLEVEKWLPLHQHLDDSGGIAELLFEHWVPASVVRLIAADAGGYRNAKSLVGWLAAVHDVGKASPAFAAQVRQLARRMIDSGFQISSAVADESTRRRVNHSLVSHKAVFDWLRSKHLRRSSACALASVVGSHHGVTPDWPQLEEVDEKVDFSGDAEWERVRHELLERATERHRPELDAVRPSMPTLVLLSALVIVADWIASNPDFFPLWNCSEVRGPDEEASSRRVKEGWARLGLPPRWTAPHPGSPAETFPARFGIPADKVREVQAGAVEVARAMQGSGLMIIEAPMGMGKTEAALAAAEVLAHDSGAHGVFMALPTQATTDAMFGRVRRWLDRLPTGATLSLAHGKAHLNDEYQGLIRSGFFATEAGAVAHDWLRGRKKSGLAEFVVGTIDQVLFAGLKSRHVMLRHLALAGKVVVIDEVHAYDVYMSRYLERVLQWLGAYRVPVILLSATLPDERRIRLLQAYDPRRQVPEQHPGYPAISATDQTPRTFPLPDRRVSVALDRLDDDLETLAAYLRTHLRDGGCAVVVRNTVSRVQETAAYLEREFEVTVNHARFLACDRAAKDRDLLQRFGPPADNAARPERHVVVASQVVEQSLDIDFDLMVTDLAPIDLVLQRLGRLHRHARPNRPVPARCAITGVDWSKSPPKPVTGSTRVYEKYYLLRAAALLTDRTELVIPDDIAPLVQAGYGPQQLGPSDWQSAISDERKKCQERDETRRAAASTYLLPEPRGRDLVGWLYANVGKVNEDTPQGMAQVRDGAESLEVVVVQKGASGGYRTPDWVDGGGQEIPEFGQLPGSLVKVLSVCTLRLPYALCHEDAIDDVISELEKTRIDSFQQTPTLRGQLVLALDDDRRAELHGFRLTYDLARGLIHERI